MLGGKLIYLFSVLIPFGILISSANVHAYGDIRFCAIELLKASEPETEEVKISLEIRDEIKKLLGRENEDNFLITYVEAQMLRSNAALYDRYLFLLKKNLFHPISLIDLAEDVKN